MADRKFVLSWYGPYSYHEWEDALKTAEYEGYSNAFSIYALTSSHQLYGDDSIVYIGMTIRDILSRLGDHSKWWEGKAYLATIHIFSTWENYDNSTLSDALYVHPDNDDNMNTTLAAEISEIEEILIYSLAPAYNSRSKNSAKKSADIRLFNVGSKNTIPNEISGRYTISKTPAPEKIDDIQLKKFGLL